MGPIRIGKVSPIKREYDKRHKSVGLSLQSEGMTRIPGTFSIKVPYKERNGEYRTGLDPNALYIKQMAITDPEGAKQEAERVEEWRKELEDFTGLDLSSRSSYYRNVYSSQQYGEQDTASPVKLFDLDTQFDLSDNTQAITFYWLRVHPEIAPSFNSWERGISTYRCPRIAECQFFINDSDYKTELEFTQNSKADKAIGILVNMSPNRQFKLAKLVGLAITYDSKPEVIYNKLSAFIKNTAKDVHKISNVDKFLQMAQLEDENLEIRYKIIEALDYNIYRKSKNKIYEGEALMADSEDELLEYLTSPKHQSDYIALLKKIDSAKKVEI